MKETIEWIDASERLPEKNQEYLVIAKDASSQFSVFSVYMADYFKHPLNTQSHWMGSIAGVSGYDSCGDDLIVTHWAELPKGPTPTLEVIPYETNS
jgi:Protein of unknown function (DUF551)